MRLLVDLGNTRVKWALCEPSSQAFDGGSKYRFFEHGSAENNESLCWRQLSNNIEHAIISSVASKELLERHCSQIKELWQCEVEIVTVELEFNELKNCYEDISALGVDRWVAAIGANTQYPNEDLIVVDAGTAITIDVVSRRNEFLGGVIMPGIHLMHHALVGNTAQIRAHANQNPPLIGRNTQQCVSSGALFSVSGGVDRAVNEFKKQLNNSSVRTLICGGDAQWIMSSSESALEYQPELLFSGLATFHNHNLKNK